MISRPLSSAILVLVSLIWAANFVLQFVVDGYRPDPIYHGVFMSVVGAALAVTKRGNGEDKHPPDPPPTSGGRHRQGDDS